MKKINTQSFLALLLLWIAGITFFIYLLISFNIFATSDKHLKSDKSAVESGKVGENKSIHESVDTANTSTEAYVFVNVNKKHFLTKFVSVVTRDDNSNKNLQPGTSPVERVVKKTRSTTVKKSTNFSIQPAPEL